MGAGNGTPSQKGSRDTQCNDRNGDRGNSRFANSSSVGEVKDNLMSQTSTKQCQDARSGEPSHQGSRGTHRGDRNGNCGNSRFANSSSAGEAIDNCISQLSITKDGPWSIQLTKILQAIPLLCQHHHYDYISGIISTNTEPTQEHFLSDHSIKRRRSSKHHVKLWDVDHIIGLDVPSGNSPINSKIVEVTPISNPYSQVHYHSDHNQGLFMRYHEWNKLIADKESVMELILDQWMKLLVRKLP